MQPSSHIQMWVIHLKKRLVNIPNAFQFRCILRIFFWYWFRLMMLHLHEKVDERCLAPSRSRSESIADTLRKAPAWYIRAKKRNVDESPALPKPASQQFWRDGTTVLSEVRELVLTWIDHCRLKHGPWPTPTPTTHNASLGSRLMAEAGGERTVARTWWIVMLIGSWSK